ncbi:ORF6N domain-containing protein [Salmonella enterica]|uniref:ORF6N domain-containing protein n=1 Tax=Salmonella enterica subsp. enterica serovar Ank TaxID=1173578 RepID=A0A726YK66_SALET|nr:ORF6N domain-containing protein [Salmonella enterica]EBY9279760.1 ORF6N domain-containing protein [Salmonella enterica subsp. enterica serovar Denver]HAE1794675.1 ORF6N domain-containing protein [Salmonella enterica subsp. enterica serovar Ank]ECD5428189.1 ORF6N domain-containing protein [Salmonella enterica subsp. enterica serovar Denver]QGR32902.1 ORF6N domain-containing protein [Salmonella enterica]HCM3794298.1 ORF6N domain-containing protein [Salmonella enterica subsp. enterica serovar 
MTTQISVETLSPITHNQIPVITTELLAHLYGTKIKNISDNFLNNTTRFVVGKHFFKIEKNELREFKNRPETIGLVGKNARSLILWTERGAARHAKMLETDQAWEVFEKLEDCYFSQKRPSTPVIPEPGSYTSRMLCYQHYGVTIATFPLTDDQLIVSIDSWADIFRNNGWLVIRKEQLLEKLMQI